MEKSQIEIGETITVGRLAEKLLIPVSKLITELMKNGVFASINEKIDFETAQIIVDELNIGVELVKINEDNDELFNDLKKNNKNIKNGEKRAPVVAIMGHVDHGKTSILDAIRSSDIVRSESGGITQHISAYQIEHNKRPITFLDTPGHEAFAAIREHGARLTDIVIIVIAADDGIKPQTLEAIRYAQKANAKIIVAINKIDKPDADINRVKQQLAEQGLVPEEWKGDTIVCEVSAKTKKGLDNLLDMILLITDVEDLKADESCPAHGLVIESHIEKGKGSVAKLLVQGGILRQNDFIVTNNTYAKIKTLTDDKNKNIKYAKPSTPVEVSGFKNLPEFGEIFKVVNNEKVAKTIVNKYTKMNSLKTKNSINSNELIRIIDRSNKLSELNLIIKADVKGSLTSVIDSLKSLDTEEVAVRIVGSGVGQIVENDIQLAISSKAIIYGFNVLVPRSTKLLASRNNIDIRVFKVIYELIDDVKNELSNLLKPEVVETEMGSLKVMGVFKTTKDEIICGGKVISGKLEKSMNAKIYRDKKLIGLALLTGIKRGNISVDNALEGEMCGINLALTSKVNILEKDVINFFTEETITRKI
ncbi:MAG: translation initiation factor IF-2 [Patescibacteria group bacterium]|jgi:translation initiation factor IF-2|nr:translation initiation factor IF-2 [Patescibacteria group bacterium]